MDTNFDRQMKIKQGSMFRAITEVLRWSVLLSFLCGSFFVPSVHAQEFDRQHFDHYLSVLDSAKRCMLSVAVHKNGELVYSSAIGYADALQGIQATEQTQYRIGSISKVFTSVLFLQLMEEGKVQLDAPLSLFYPDLPRAEEITMEMLLRHRSGLFNYTALADFEWFKDSVHSEQTLLARIDGLPLDFDPGSRFAYSNTNYILLTFIVERLSGLSYAELLEKRIVQPLGLQHTFYANGLHPEMGQALSHEFAADWRPLTSETHLTVSLGAGGIWSTPQDLNRFLFGIFHSGLLKESSLKEMTKLSDRYGLGIMSIPYYTYEALGHGGNIDSFHSMTGHFLEDGWTVSATTNGCRESLNDIMIHLLDLCYGKTFDLPVFEEGITYSDEELTSFCGSYTHPDLPFTIEVRSADGGLIVQASGQSSFRPESSVRNVFEYSKAQLKLTFHPEKDVMVLEQGRRFEMHRD